MSDKPQLHKPAAPTITETGEQLLDIGIKGIVRQVTYERDGDTIRVLRPHGRATGGKSIGAKEIYACQGAFVPPHPPGKEATSFGFWFRIPAGSIEQAFARVDEALALAGSAFEKRLKARLQAKAREIVRTDRMPQFRRGGTGGNGDRQ